MIMSPPIHHIFRASVLLIEASNPSLVRLRKRSEQRERPSVILTSEHRDRRKDLGQLRVSEAGSGF